MSFSTEKIVFHDQRYCDRNDKRIVAWIDLKVISLGREIKSCKYVKVGLTGVCNDTVLIEFHETKVKGSIKL